MKEGQKEGGRTGVLRGSFVRNSSCGGGRTDGGKE